MALNDCEKSSQTARTFGERSRNLGGLLKERLEAGTLKLVLFYARGIHTTTLWSEVCDIHDWHLHPNLQGDFLRQKHSAALLLCIQHPSRGRIGRDQEADFMRGLATHARRL